MSQHVVVLSTVADMDQAERIAAAVVSEGLAACVNVVPGLTSVYRWKGKLERAQECLLVIKTRSGCYESLREAILALHAYEVPEIIALPIHAGHAPYLAWIDESVGTR